MISLDRITTDEEALAFAEEGSRDLARRHNLRGTLDGEKQKILDYMNLLAHLSINVRSPSIRQEINALSNLWYSNFRDLSDSYR